MNDNQFSHLNRPETERATVNKKEVNKMAKEIAESKKPDKEEDTKDTETVAKYFLIKVDAGADDKYVSVYYEITDAILKQITPVIKAIKEFKPYEIVQGEKKYLHDKNYPTGKRRMTELGEKSVEELYGHLESFIVFNELVPVSDNVNNIFEIKLLEVSKVEKLL